MEQTRIESRDGKFKIIQKNDGSVLMHLGSVIFMFYPAQIEMFEKATIGGLTDFVMLDHIDIKAKTVDVIEVMGAMYNKTDIHMAIIKNQLDRKKPTKPLEI